MKSLHCVYNKNRFADQYTLDLEGFMSPHEFTATINTFNTAAWHYPPPNPSEGSVTFYICLFVICLLIGATTTIYRTQQQGFVLLALPFVFLVCSGMVMYYRKRQRRRFESAMVHLCACMNATENVRGINFRLTFLTPERQISTRPTSCYAITIEFDDRYNLLHHFTDNPNHVLPSYYNHSTSIDIPPPPPLCHSLMQDKISKPSNTYYPNEKNMTLQ